MPSKKEYFGILKIDDKAILKIEDNSPNKIIVFLSCKLEDEYHDAKGQIYNKTTGEMVYQCQKTAIC